MSSSTLENKIRKYSALAIASIAGIGSANAQLAYTDIPDHTVGFNETFPIDLDGNGSIDFNLMQEHVQSTNWLYLGGTYTSSGGWTTIGTWNVTIHNKAKITPGSYNAVLNSTGASVIALDKPEHVSGGNSFNPGTANMASYTLNYGWGFNAGQFSDGNEHYVGVKFTDGSNMHYGWIRLKVANDVGSADVFDFGYEQTPNASIHAGGFPTTFTGSGDWYTGAWDKGIPSTADDAIIDAGADITVDADASCFNFINNGSVSLGSYVLNIGAHLDNASGNFDPGSGTVNLVGDFTMDATRKINNDIDFYNLSVFNPNISYSIDANIVNIDNDFANTGSQSIIESAGTELTVSGNIINNGEIDIKSNVTATGSFINYGTISGTGVFNVEKYLTDNRWWYLGSPMSDATAGSFGTLAPLEIHLYSWDEPAQSYTSITSGADALSVLNGYSYKNFDIAGGPQTALFTGTLNYGSTGYADNLSSAVSGTYAGFNLVCNPYPSAINVGDAITHPGLTMTNINPTFWFRTDGSYATYNWTTGIGSPESTTSFIPAMQGFWVRVSAPGTGTFGLDNDARVHNSQSFYKESLSSDIFRIEVLNGNLSDEAVVHFNQNAQSSFDPYDSEKMLATDPGLPQIYSLTGDNREVAINGVNELNLNEDRIIPLGLNANLAGNYSFYANNIANFDPDVEVYLEDLTNGTLQNLRQNDTYTFYTGIVTNANRFRLHFGEIATNIPEEAADAITAYSFENTIYVYSPEEGANVAGLYDMLGNMVEKSQISKGLNRITTNVANGVYTLRIDGKSKPVEKKIVISN